MNAVKQGVILAREMRKALVDLAEAEADMQYLLGQSRVPKPNAK